MPGLSTISLHAGEVPAPATGVTVDFIRLSVGLEDIAGIDYSI